MIYLSWGKHANHYTTDAVDKKLGIKPGDKKKNILLLYHA